MRGETARRDEQRRRVNEESKRWATRSKERWTDEDDMVILDEWILVSACERDELAIAKHLQRTVAACRDRAELLRERLDVKDVNTATKPEQYIGHDDDPEDQWWSPDYYTK